MSKKLEGKVALVSGSGRGIGREIALKLASEGARLVINDLDAAPAAQTVADIAAGGGQAVACVGSVTDAGFADRFVKQALDSFGGLDIIVNNAGYTHRNRPLLEVDEATFDRVFDVNVKSIYHMVQAAAAAMRDNGGGVILNVGSTAGIRPRPGLTWYNASKGAVNLMSKSLAVELAPWKIRVNAICPVMGVTGMLGDFMGVPDTPENRAKFIATIPLGRLSEGRDVAEAALYLAASDFITGVELPVDGGRTV